MLVYVSIIIIILKVIIISRDFMDWTSYILVGGKSILSFSFAYLLSG